MMKKVLFILFLSVSVCISRAEQPAGVQESQQASNPTTEHQTEKVSTPIPNQTTQNASQSVKPSTTTENTKPAEASTAGTTSVKPQTVQPEKSTEPPKETAAKDEKSSTLAVVPTTEKTVSSSTIKPDIKNDTTTKPAPTTTLKPGQSTVTPILQTRAFDGASFVGGIILTLGILVIGFMGFKYYKNQTERNYHTL